MEFACIKVQQRKLSTVKGQKRKRQTANDTKEQSTRLFRPWSEMQLWLLAVVEFPWKGLLSKELPGKTTCQEQSV
jgi:hypothetical protein